MSEPMKWSCSCGKVQGTCAAGKGSRIICYCESCRAFVADLGARDVLDDAGGNDLLQTAPEAFEITQGADLVAWTKLTEKGPMRWFATCCNTPFANTASKSSIPFLSLQTSFFDQPDRAGKIVARVNRKGATGHIEGEMGSLRGVLFALAGRMIRSRVTGGYKKNPFFDGAGAPIAARATVASEAPNKS